MLARQKFPEIDGTLMQPLPDLEGQTESRQPELGLAAPCTRVPEGIDLTPSIESKDEGREEPREIRSAKRPENRTREDDEYFPLR